MTDPRQNVAGVRFRNAGPIEYFHAAGMRLEVGESVIVETSRGPELARVVIAPDQVVVNELGEDNLHPILRLATEDDLVHASDLAARAEELLPEARKIAEEAGLEGRVDRAEFTLDGERLTFLVSGEGAGGQREFSRQAGRRWDVRASVRRIGARDRARRSADIRGGDLGTAPALPGATASAGGSCAARTGSRRSPRSPSASPRTRSCRSIRRRSAASAVVCSAASPTRRRGTKK